MENLYDFFSDYTLQIVALASMILGILSGAIGSFAVLRKESLLGDAISHAALPGIAIAFLITKTKNTEILLIGALISGILANAFIIVIDKYTRIKFDSALGLVLSVFFGVGLVLMTFIQKIPNANQAGLEKFIFGQASTMLSRDIKIMTVLGILLLLLVFILWKEFKIISFDLDFAHSLGYQVKILTFILTSLIVVVIILGLQMVGVILMSAMLVAPAVAARQWTNKLYLLVILSAFIGGFSGITGTIISSSIKKMPTGPSIVLVVSAFVFLSILFAPNRGLIFKIIKDRNNSLNINRKKVLINLYYLSENHNRKKHSHDLITIKPLANTKFKKKKTLSFLIDLESKGYIKKEYFDKWSITLLGSNYVEEILKDGGF